MHVIRILLLSFLLFPSSSVLAQEPEFQNWFNDPFFRISNEIANCPMPRGPYTTEKQRLAEAHHRAERGTTCWLVGKCDRPTSYDYDEDIAVAIKQSVARDNPFPLSTLWGTVQGRVVYVQGCASNKIAVQVEKYLMDQPYVEIAVAKIMTTSDSEAPYPVLAK